MPTFKLPRGYSFQPPPEIEQSILVDGAGLYGGATISDAYDAISAHYVLCCATGPGEPPFRLRGFRCAPGSSTYREVPLAIVPPGAVITGRGSCDVQFIDGDLHFSGWRDKEFFTGTIPGFVPFPSIPSLEQRIAALERGGGGVPSQHPFTLATAPVTSPAWEGRMLDGGILVDIPATFTVPSSSAYLVRFVAQATAPNVRVRAGTEAAPYFLTLNTQAPGLQVPAQGWAPGPICYISTVNGPATLWLQVVGWF